MKNTGKKIFILGGVISVALAGILVFYPTIVAPPNDVPVNNLHKSSLETDLSAFSDFENVAFNDSIYNIVIDKLYIYKNEEYFMTISLQCQFEKNIVEIKIFDNDNQTKRQLYLVDDSLLKELFNFFL